MVRVGLIISGYRQCGVLVGLLAAVGLHAVLLCAGAAADAPPSWNPFVSCTAGEPPSAEEFCAQIKPSAPADNPAQAEYALRVTRGRPEKGEFLWQRKYHYSGYPSGTLSPEGATFIYVSFWFYQDMPVVRIYRKSSHYVLTGDAFKLPPLERRATASHEVWLAEGSKENFRFITPETFQITTIKGREFIIDLRDGCELISAGGANKSERRRPCGQAAE